MEKKHYILIGALVLIGILILAINLVGNSKEKEGIEFGIKKFGADLPEKQRNAVTNSNSIGEVYSTEKLSTICSS